MFIVVLYIQMRDAPRAWLTSANTADPHQNTHLHTKAKVRGTRGKHICLSRGPLLLNPAREILVLVTQLTSDWLPAPLRTWHYVGRGHKNRCGMPPKHGRWPRRWQTPLFSKVSLCIPEIAAGKNRLNRFDLHLKGAARSTEDALPSLPSMSCHHSESKNFHLPQPPKLCLVHMVVQSRRWQVPLFFHLDSDAQKLQRVKIQRLNRFDLHFLGLTAECGAASHHPCRSWLLLLLLSSSSSMSSSSTQPSATHKCSCPVQMAVWPGRW